jgi:hypothetical protein
LEVRVQVNATDVKLAQSIELVMTSTEGKLIISLAEAGKLGVCFNLKV